MKKSAKVFYVSFFLEIDFRNMKTLGQAKIQNSKQLEVDKYVFQQIMSYTDLLNFFYLN
jgi:hypothetical protein